VLVVTTGIGSACRATESRTGPTAFDGTLVGTVLRYQDRAPVRGATVSFASASAVTDVNGTFQLTGVPASGPLRLTATAAGYLERATWLTMPAPGDRVEFDMIEDAAPFSLGLYRELARNAYERSDQLSLVGLRRWTMAPGFYFKTTLEDGEGEVPVDLIDRIAASFVNSVPDLSGGRLDVASVEFGPSERSVVEGWVNVYFYRKLEGALGTASVGGNQGVINLTYDPERSVEPPCPSVTLAIAEHEIVHTMGFWHTETHWFPDPWLENPFRTRDCLGNREPITKYHAAVAYSRVRLNRDEDLDPATPIGALDARADVGSRPAVDVYCFVR
jgi:hypothetical protein